MADNIQTMIPRYGELNRIYRDYIDNSTFSFDRQKFISDFCQQYNESLWTSIPMKIFCPLNEIAFLCISVRF